VLHESRESADLIHAVETGDIDVTFIDIGPYETGSLQVRRLIDDPMVLVAHADPPEAGRRAVSITDVAHLPMIGTRNPDAGKSSTTPSARRQSCRASAAPARDLMAPRAQAASNPPALCQRGSRNL
jgi:DNA-binding transcriptional LysR family regulator